MGKRILAICLSVVLVLCVFTGCTFTQEPSGHTVRFNTCINLETNTVKDQILEAGELVARPNVYLMDETYSQYMISGWYADEEYTKEWNFESDVVEGDMVLYAKWERQFFIRYFTSIEKNARLGIFVSEGELAPKQDGLIPGRHVAGYYTDATYSEKFDFKKPIMADTDVYMLMEEGIHWDAKEIADNFECQVASGETSTIGTISYVDEGKDSYALVDFGYAERSDARIAAYGPLDLTKSQICTIKYKNLGNAKAFRIFWTVEYEDGTVSGQNLDERTWDFCDVPIKSGMSADDEWATLTLDMCELSVINGASQWTGGKYLHMFRIDSLYSAGMDPEYVPNIMHFKDICFTAGEEYVSGDNLDIEVDNIFDVMAAAKEQEAIKNGYVFPLDREKSQPKQGTVQYNMIDCVTYLFPYGTKNGLVNYDMSHMGIDMEANQMIYLQYKNEGSSKFMTLRYENTDGTVGEKLLEIKTKMNGFSTLGVNMLTDTDWNGKLDSLSLVYHKKDANNVLSLKSIYLKPFEATQLPGINFADKKCAGFKDNDDYIVLFDPKTESSYFQMAKETMTLQKSVSLNTAVYSSLNFTYNNPVVGVDKIEVSYQIGGIWYTEKIKNVKKTSGFETVTFDLQKKGQVSAMRIKVTGKGKISFRSLVFGVDPEYSLEFSDGKYISDHFQLGWGIKNTLDYDPIKGAAFLTGSAAADARCTFYFGASGYRENIRLDSANKKVYVCYNNPGEAREITLGVYYAPSSNLKGSGIAGDDPTVKETKSVATTAKIKGNMKDGEWAVAVFDFSDLKLFSADRNATMISIAACGDLYVRNIVLD